MTDASTTCAEASDNLSQLKNIKKKNPGERSGWSIDIVAVGKCVI